jgi:hypothetical protein
LAVRWWRLAIPIGEAAAQAGAIGLIPMNFANAHARWCEVRAEQDRINNTSAPDEIWRRLMTAETEAVEAMIACSASGLVEVRQRAEVIRAYVVDLQEFTDKRVARLAAALVSDIDRLAN